MTRKEEIRQAANEYSDKLAVLCEAGNLFKDFCNGAKWADEHPQFVHTDNSQVIANLEAEIGRLKNPWISVKDRLPESFKEVIALAANGHIENSYWDGNYWTGDFYDTTVTHWMPIPEIPKGGEV